MNLGLYTYAHNKPIVAMDPSGFYTIFVSGTGSGNKDVDKDVASTYKETFPGGNGEYETFKWSGGNSDVDRNNAARQLADRITEYRKNNPNEPINVIGHSHGGNVGLKSTTYLPDDVSIDNIVTLGTPIRDDYQPDMGKIKSTWYNVYSPSDGVQVKGGRHVFRDRAVRTSPDAINLRINLDAGGILGVGNGTHSALYWNSNVAKSINNSIVDIQGGQPEKLKYPIPVTVEY